jgi:hypothetical protein
MFVESLDKNIMKSKVAQARIEELIEKAEMWYIDSLHNVIFTTMQIADLEADIKEDATEDELKSVKNVKDNNEKTLRSNKWWMKQYEVAIPYLKSLIKKESKDTSKWWEYKIF